MPKNVDAFGKTIDSFKPVLDDYGNPIQSSNVTTTGHVINPYESVYDEWEVPEGSNFNIKDVFKVSLLIPGVAAVYLEYLFDWLMPIMKILTLPSILVVVITLLLIPNVKEVIKINKIDTTPTKYKKLLKWNYICGFMVFYPILSPPLFELTNQLGRYMIDNGATEGSLIIAVLSVIFIATLYFLRYLLIIAIVPLAQWFILRYVDEKFLNKKLQKIALKFLK